MYPNMESKVNAQLARTGTFFQSYIRRGLANLEAEAQAAATATTSIPSPLSASSNGGIGGIGSASSASEAMAAAAARRRESVLSLAKSESDASVAGLTTSADPAESYKDRLARLQQMFGYKSVRPCLYYIYFISLMLVSLDVRVANRLQPYAISLIGVQAYFACS